jgi:hypothetical protein
VTEPEWLGCTDPTPMVEFQGDKASDRKLRLFARACCRRIWRLFLHSDSFRSIEVGERFVEGKATDEELQTAEEVAMGAGDDASWTSMQAAVNAWAAAAPGKRRSMPGLRLHRFRERELSVSVPKGRGNPAPTAGLSVGARSPRPLSAQALRQ